MAETRKAPARKTAAPTTRKQPAKKTTKKQPAKKPPAKTATTAPKASARPQSGDGARPGSSAAQLALSGARQLVDLTGKEFEGVVGIARNDDGWAVQVEVLEMRRIPNTTDVLAVYEVTVDRSGDLLGYRRVDRYVRGSAGEERQ